jgi:hypothetical protein
VPIEDVAARDIAAGDVVRLDDPQARRVERAVHVDGRIVLELRPVGLEIWETLRVSLPEDRLVSRLGAAAESARRGLTCTRQPMFEARQLMTERAKQHETRGRTAVFYHFSQTATTAKAHERRSSHRTSYPQSEARIHGAALRSPTLGRDRFGRQRRPLVIVAVGRIRAADQPLRCVSRGVWLTTSTRRSRARRDPRAAL